MKGLKNGTLRMRCIGCVFVAAASLALQSNAQNYSLNNGNSVVDINATSGLGMFDYKVNGLNQLTTQWFWYRIGNSGPERPINSVGPGVFVQSDARSLDLSYANNLYSARVVYSLTGGTPGTGSSSLNESVTFLNSSASALDLHFFDYTDFDLLGSGGGQTIQFGTTSIPSPRINKFTQNLGAITATVSLTAGLYNPSLAEAAIYNQTLTSLTDLNPTTLSGVMGPITGDVTGALQWDVSLAPGTSLTISKLISFQNVPVPEPSALGLVALGFAVALYRQRRA